MARRPVGRSNCCEKSPGTANRGMRAQSLWRECSCGCGILANVIADTRDAPVLRSRLGPRAMMKSVRCGSKKIRRMARPARVGTCRALGKNLDANESEAKRHETSCFDRVGIFHAHGRERVRLRGERSLSSRAILASLALSQPIPRADRGFSGSIFIRASLYELRPPNAVARARSQESEGASGERSTMMLVQSACAA